MSCILTIGDRPILKAGAEAFFQKPVDNAELLNSIQQALMK